MLRRRREGLGGHDRRIRDHQSLDGMSVTIDPRHGGAIGGPICLTGQERLVWAEWTAIFGQAAQWGTGWFRLVLQQLQCGGVNRLLIFNDHGSDRRRLLRKRCVFGRYDRGAIGDYRKSTGC